MIHTWNRREKKKNVRIKLRNTIIRCDYAIVCVKLLKHNELKNELPAAFKWHTAHRVFTAAEEISNLDKTSH